MNEPKNLQSSNMLRPLLIKNKNDMHLITHKYTVLLKNNRDQKFQNSKPLA